MQATFTCNSVGTGAGAGAGTGTTASNGTGAGAGAGSGIATCNSVGAGASTDAPARTEAAAVAVSNSQFGTFLVSYACIWFTTSGKRDTSVDQTFGTKVSNSGHYIGDAGVSTSSTIRPHTPAVKSPRNLAHRVEKITSVGCAHSC